MLFLINLIARECVDIIVSNRICVYFDVVVTGNNCVFLIRMRAFEQI